jgi:hypothetical protein
VQESINSRTTKKSDFLAKIGFLGTGVISPNPLYYTEHCHKLSFFVMSFDLQQWSYFNQISP